MPKFVERTNTYFEGIIQLRNSRQEVIDYIVFLVNSKKGVFISNMMPVKSGFDIYVSSQRFLRNLGKLVHERFGGELRFSSSLHTKDNQSSKDLYRVNVFIKLPEYIKNDVVKVNDKIFIIKGFSKNSVSCVDLLSGKNTTLNNELEFEVLHKVKTTISKVKPHLEVLHPVTFDSVPVNGVKEYKLDDEVLVVVVGNSAVLVE